MNLELLRKNAAYRALLAQIAATLVRLDDAAKAQSQAAEELEGLIKQVEEHERGLGNGKP